MRGLTKNQVELLLIVRKQGPDGPIDFDQLLDQLSWTPSKESAQFTIRALIGKGVLEKLTELQFRRSRKRICYQLTDEGHRFLDPRAPLAGLTERSKPLKPGVLEGFEEPELLTSGISLSAESESSMDLLEVEDFFRSGAVSVASK